MRLGKEYKSNGQNEICSTELSFPSSGEITKSFVKFFGLLFMNKKLEKCKNKLFLKITLKQI